MTVSMSLTYFITGFGRLGQYFDTFVALRLTFKKVQSEPYPDNRIEILPQSSKVFNKISQAHWDGHLDTLTSTVAQSVEKWGQKLELSKYAKTPYKIQVVAKVHLYGVHAYVTVCLFSITSERIELESMLRCLNDRLNEPKTPTKFDGARPTFTIRLSH